VHRRRPGRHRRGGDGLTADLPYVDTHEVAAAAPPDAVWAALPIVLEGSFDRPRTRILSRILGCDEENGFHVSRSDPSRALVLEGRHRFSRYRLAFEIEPAGAGSRLRAVTHAEFPGLRGRMYRALVIGSGGHRVLTRRLLRSVARRAERDPIPHPAVPYIVKEAP